MELRQLEAFAAVMSAGSVTAAGRMLGRSQPAISRLLQDLESEIGYALFTRSGPRVTPTEQGFLLYEDVERALVGMKQIRTRAEEIARGDGRPLRLAATPALSAGLLPIALAAISSQTCPTQIQLRSASPEHVVHAVLTDAVQLGVTSLPVEHRGLTVHWIGQAPCAVAVPAAGKLAAMDVVPLSALAGQRIITMSNPFRLRRRLDQAFAQAGVITHGLIETNSSLNAMTAVRAGLGISVLEPVTAYGAPIEGVAVRPIDVDIPFLFGVITPLAKPLTPAVQTLIDALERAAADLLPGFVRREANEHAAVLQSLYGDEPTLTETVES
ncbi:LysR substrate-binding domain-containing protein [Alcaligenaceae bacterium A4P071]|nr:LysR substrate-binding domain-containing protein [Alcaligenaceae bacterium C4P045]MDQ2186253.1 LysR substrate-binding domain-containing protein [Alcaligenaceae bacterium A4P071]